MRSDAEVLSQPQGDHGAGCCGRRRAGSRPARVHPSPAAPLLRHLPAVDAAHDAGHVRQQGVGWDGRHERWFLDVQRQRPARCHLRSATRRRGGAAASRARTAPGRAVVATLDGSCPWASCSRWRPRGSSDQLNTAAEASPRQLGTSWSPRGRTPSRRRCPSSSPRPLSAERARDEARRTGARWPVSSARGCSAGCCCLLPAITTAPAAAADDPTGCRSAIAISDRGG